MRTGQLQRLQLTDICDGRLYLDGRIIVLADPVLERLNAYLDYRNTRWPRACNPYLLLTRRTGIRLEPPGARWI